MNKRKFYIIPETDITAINTSMPLAVLSYDPYNDGVPVKNTGNPDDDLDPDNGDEILSKGRNVWNDWD